MFISLTFGPGSPGCPGFPCGPVGPCKNKISSWNVAWKYRRTRQWESPKHGCSKKTQNYAKRVQNPPGFLGNSPRDFMEDSDAVLDLEQHRFAMNAQAHVRCFRLHLRSVCVHMKQDIPAHMYSSCTHCYKPWNSTCTSIFTHPNANLSILDGEPLVPLKLSIS